MGWRFRRSIKILPGVRWNFGKRSSSLSVGGRGYHVTVGPRGVRRTIGLPGTGLSYTTYSRRKPTTAADIGARTTASHSASVATRVVAPSAEDLARFHLERALYPPGYRTQRRLCGLGMVTCALGLPTIGSVYPVAVIIALVLGVVLLARWLSIPSAAGWAASEDSRLATEVARARETERLARNERTHAFAAQFDAKCKPLGVNTTAELDELERELRQAGDINGAVEAPARAAIDARRRVLAFLATKTEDGFPPAETALPLDDRPCFFEAAVTVDARALHERARISLVGAKFIVTGDDLSRHEWPYQDVRAVNVSGSEMTLGLKSRKTPLSVHFADNVAAFCAASVFTWRATANGIAVNGRPDVTGESKPPTAGSGA
jgi:hypothetical protein